MLPKQNIKLFDYCDLQEWFFIIRKRCIFVNLKCCSDNKTQKSK